MQSVTRVVRVDNPEVYGNLRGFSSRSVAIFQASRPTWPLIPLSLSLPSRGGGDANARASERWKAVSGGPRENISGLNADPGVPSPLEGRDRERGISPTRKVAQHLDRRHATGKDR